DMRLGVDAGRDEGGGHLADRTRQLGRVLPGGDGVQVDHAIDAVVALLQLDEPLDRAEIVAEVQVAGRLHAGKDEMLERHGFTLQFAGCMPWRLPRGKGGHARSRTAASSVPSRVTPKSCSASA